MLLLNPQSLNKSLEYFAVYQYVDRATEIPIISTAIFFSKPVFSGLLGIMYTLCFSSTSKELKNPFISLLLIHSKDQL